LLVFVEGKDLVTWELYLEYYLKGEGQLKDAAHATTSWAAQFGSSSDTRLSTSISPSARASFIAKTKKRMCFPPTPSSLSATGFLHL
jgi:hypothetical protein